MYPITVERRSDDAVEIRWKETAGRDGLAVYRGDSPERIQTASPLAEVTGGGSVTLSGLAADSPHFFKLVAADGASAIVGERRPVVEGAPNLRDLGGYEATDGRRVKWGRIFRSSNLGNWGSSSSATSAPKPRRTSSPTDSRTRRPSIMFGFPSSTANSSPQLFSNASRGVITTGSL
ncbi:MAG: tyrosine-protein phosphatase, partial [Desulfobacterales bacterium]|nr:tyrosine-protein phosphatase [Desulfobacterales bacterium]